MIVLSSVNYFGPNCIATICLLLRRIIYRSVTTIITFDVHNCFQSFFIAGFNLTL